jgi:hypothetical protein
MDQEKNYISLQEASSHCDYSQEYLSLRARQGKLKSTKNGRNWVTTLEWLQEYIKSTEEIKAEIEKAKEVKLTNKIEQKIPVKIIEKAKIMPAPENSPAKSYFIQAPKRTNNRPSLPLVLSAFIILFFSSVILGKDSIMQSLNYFNTASQITGNASDFFINEGALGVREAVSSAGSFENLAIKNISEKISQASLAVALPNNVGSLTQENISDVNQIDRLEMKDQSTGAIYCTWIEDGWWVKVQSSCKDIPQKKFSGQ